MRKVNKDFYTYISSVIAIPPWREKQSNSAHYWIPAFTRLAKALSKWAKMTRQKALVTTSVKRYTIKVDTSTLTQKLQERKKATSRYIHSENHALADKLSKALGDPKHFVVYLKLAEKHNHQKLLQILGNVLDKQNVSSPAKLFMYLVKNK